MKIALLKDVELWATWLPKLSIVKSLKKNIPLNVISLVWES